MPDTYYQTSYGYGVVDDPANVPAGATIISQATYDAAIADQQAALAAAQFPPLDFTSPLRPGVGAVAFSWDDGWDSAPTVAQMHAQRNQLATFYITTNLLNTTQHITTAQLQAIAAQGHEIGYHALDHVDQTGLTVPDRVLQWDGVATVNAAIASTGKTVVSYAYPYGNNNAVTNAEAVGRFDRVATIGLSQGYYTGASGYGPWLYEPGTGGFEGFKHGRFPWNQATHAQFMRLLKDYVLKRGVILPTYAHQIGNSDTPTMAQVTEALDFCARNAIPCITAEQAFPAPKVVNPGFEYGLDGWTVVTAGAATGTAVVDVIADTPYQGLPGTKSLRVNSPNTSTSADSVHIFQTVPVRGLMAYSLSARVRYDAGVSGAGKWSVRINEFNEAGGSIAGRSVRGSASGAVWGQSSAAPAADAVWTPASGLTHPSARYMTVGLYLQELTGIFYADHVYFGPTEEGLLG